MISKEFLELLYDAASIQRWNDHIRPHIGFTELDKQAHKMVFAYVLAKTEESDRGIPINWRGLIEGGIFEFLHRIKLTDIKPTIYHELMKNKGPEINTWVLEKLSDYVNEIKEPFAYNFKEYLFNIGYCALEKRILKAAHYLATNWEFGIIYNLNSTLYGLEQTRENIENEIEEHYDLAGVQKIKLGKKTHAFLDMVGQLRFQKRWAQTPRVPETSVLGHMLIVAMLAYLFSAEIGSCDKRIYNNFYGGLFHDLPEVVTRDIVSPVKSSVEGLEEIIKDIEKKQIEEKIFPLLPVAWHQEIKYFIENEFISKIMKDGKIEFLTSDEINSSYNHDKCSPLDGQLIEICDKIAALMEASISISLGIKSYHLEEGRDHVYSKYSNSKVAGIDFKPMFDLFKV